MSLFKRGKTWWTDFSLNGVRYRMSLDTTDWREAQTTEKEKITQASTGRLAPNSQQFGRLGFQEAISRYLEDRAPQLSPRSARSQTDHAKPLCDYFGATQLFRITSEHVLAYVRFRKEKQISNVTINMEIGILRRVLKRAKRWSLISDDISRLPERRDIGRALPPEHKVYLVRIASARPEWQIVRLATILALNTTMRGCELRGLHWRDVNFIERTLTIRRSKTEAGDRLIPLNGDAWAAILELRERIKLFYAGEPQADWFVFPSGEGRDRVQEQIKPRYDPIRPSR